MLIGITRIKIIPKAANFIAKFLTDKFVLFVNIKKIPAIQEIGINKAKDKEPNVVKRNFSKKITVVIKTVYDDGTNLEARKNMQIASFKAGVAFTRAYVGYVHAIAHSLGGKYNVPHGLANAVILPYVLKSYGKSAHKKLWKLGVYSGLFDKNTTFEEGARMFIEKIEELNKQMNIPTKLEQVQEQDIVELAKTAEHEANPLYPVPKLFTAKELEKIYYQIKEK